MESEKRGRESGEKDGERSVVALSKEAHHVLHVFVNFGLLGTVCTMANASTCILGPLVSEDITVKARLQGHRKATTGIALPSGSHRLCSGSNDGAVRIWDCPTGEKEAGCSRGKRFVRFGLIFTGDAAGEVTVWEWLKYISALPHA